MVGKGGGKGEGVRREVLAWWEGWEGLWNECLAYFCLPLKKWARTQKHTPNKDTHNKKYGYFCKGLWKLCLVHLQDLFRRRLGSCHIFVSLGAGRCRFSSMCEDGKGFELISSSATWTLRMTMLLFSLVFLYPDKTGSFKDLFKGLISYII